MKLSAIIVDDEKHCSERLQKLLLKHCNDSVEVTAIADNISDAVTFIEETKPDIAFLDIQLGNHTGFDLLERLSKVNFAVIFTTAYEQYAVKAFRFSAIDYLLKPIVSDDLIDAVNKVKASQKLKEDDWRLLLNNVRNQLITGNKKIAIPTLTGFQLIALKDIVRCKSDGNYTWIFLSDQSKRVVSRTLKEFERMLQEDGFIRVHHAHLVNINFIKEYHKGNGGYVILSDQSEIEVSVRKKDALLEYLGMK